MEHRWWNKYLARSLCDITVCFRVHFLKREASKISKDPLEEHLFKWELLNHLMEQVCSGELIE